jgi:hypothetical protein
MSLILSSPRRIEWIIVSHELHTLVNKRYILVFRLRKYPTVADKYGLHPNNIFNGKQQLFERGVHLFEPGRPDITEMAEERRIAVLEEKLR